VPKFQADAASLLRLVERYLGSDILQKSSGPLGSMMPDMSSCEPQPLVSGRCYWQVASRPGPASAHSASASPFGPTDTDGSRRFVRAGARPTGRRGGFPTGRPWDFASQTHDLLHHAKVTLLQLCHDEQDHTPVPGPVPRIRVACSGHYWPTLASRGSDVSHLATTLSSPALTPLAATLTRLAF
jgi:hypothetical protein